MDQCIVFILRECLGVSLLSSWYLRLRRRGSCDVSVSVSVGGDSSVGSVAVMYSVSDDVLSDLYRSLKTANSTNLSDGSDCVS